MDPLETTAFWPGASAPCSCLFARAPCLSHIPHLLKSACMGCKIGLRQKMRAGKHTFMTLEPSRRYRVLLPTISVGYTRSSSSAFCTCTSQVCVRPQLNGMRKADLRPPEDSEDHFSSPRLQKGPFADHKTSEANAGYGEAGACSSVI